MNCPYCNSSDTDFLKKKNKWLCNNCDKAFVVERNSELATNPLRIFVSYGHDEYSPFAKELNRSLKKRGHKTFLDGEWLKEGKEWELQLEKGLDFIAEDPENGRILLIVTPYSVRRNEEPMGYCLNEIAKALDKRMTIIPIMLVWAEMPLSIYRLQYLDLSKSPDEKNITANFESDFAQICRVVETRDLLDSTGGMSSLKSALDPLDFMADLTYFQPWFTGRQWVFDDIQKWLNDENASRMFWITGVPGIGKTTIATKLQLLKNVVAFHLCRRGHSEKASPKRIVCSLAYQLSTQIKSYRDILSTIPVKEEVERANAVALFDILIVQPLHKVASPYDYPLVILIDGLDEASHDGRNEVAQFLAAEFDKLPKWLRIILTSRPEQEIIAPLQSKFEPWVLDPESTQNEKDIIDYLNKRLKKYNDREDYQKIINVLSDNAKGVFQYAKCVCDNINENRYDLNRLEKLPKDLARVYMTYFDDKFKNIKTYREIVRPSLMIIAAAYKPLSRDELAELTGFSYDDIDDFLNTVGSYIVVRADETLSSSHKSFFDWLDFETNKFEEISNKYSFKNIDAHKLICNYNIDQAEYSRLYLLEFCVDHAIECENWDLALTYYKSIDLIDERIDRLGQYRSIEIYFNNISELVNKSISKHKHIKDKVQKCLFEIYGSQEFIYMINKCSSLMFDMEYYKVLKNNKFDEFIDRIDINNQDIGFKQILISYYYINNEIGKAVKIEIDNIDLSNIDSYEKNYLLTQAKATNLLGVCNRIIGNFEIAVKYLNVTIKIYNLLGKQDSESIVCGNLARVYLMVDNFEKTYDVLQYGKSIMIESTTGNEEKDFISKLHQYNGCVHILAGVYLQNFKPDNAEDELKHIGELYLNPKFRDRYWFRYIYTLSMCSILRGDLQSAKDTLKQLDGIAKAENNLHIKNLRSLINWIEGKLKNDIEALKVAKDTCYSTMLDLYSKSNYESFIEVYALYKHICFDLDCDDNLSNFTVKDNILNWGRFKFEWFKNIFNLFK